MGNFLNKLFGSTEDVYDDYDDYSEEDAYGTAMADDPVPESPPRPSSRLERSSRRAQNRTVPFPGAPQQKSGHEVILSEASGIDDAWSICDHVKMGRTVVCNTEELSPEIRVRFQDVVSGCAYAIGGILQAVSQYIFIFAPYTARIKYDEGRELFNPMSNRDSLRDADVSGLFDERDSGRRFMR